MRLLGSAGASENAFRVALESQGRLKLRPETPSVSLRSPKCTRRACSGAACALDTAAWASPKAARSLEKLLRASTMCLCTRNGCLGKPQGCQVAREACPSELRNRIAFKLLFESTARSYCSKSHVSATLYSHPLTAVPLAKCMECTGSH